MQVTVLVFATWRSHIFYHVDLDIRRHAAWTWAYSKDMGMQHGHGHAAWNGLTGLDYALDFLLM